jgi:hypothetical protein
MIFGTSDIRLRVVDYDSNGDSFTAGQPRALVDLTQTTGRRVAGFMPDGKRLMITLPAGLASDQKPAHTVFLLNFFEEVQRRLPVGK